MIDSMKKKDIAVLLVSIGIAGIILANYSSKDSIIGIVLDPFEEPEWDEIKPRDIVKNTIPITLLERNGECLVTANNLNIILEQVDFTQRDNLASKLSYDDKEQTIKIRCEELVGETSNLHIWFIIPDSPVYAGKFTYFVTDVDTGVADAVIP